MDTEQIGSNSAVEKVVGDLQKDFKIVGSHRVHSWYAWAIVGIVFGMALGIVYVANRSGQIENSDASMGFPGRYGQQQNEPGMMGLPVPGQPGQMLGTNEEKFDEPGFFATTGGGKFICNCKKSVRALLDFNNGTEILRVLTRNEDLDPPFDFESSTGQDDQVSTNSQSYSVSKNDTACSLNPDGSPNETACLATCNQWKTVFDLKTYILKAFKDNPTAFASATKHADNGALTAKPLPPEDKDGNGTCTQ
jgi:hypothetical protein